MITISISYKETHDGLFINLGGRIALYNSTEFVTRISDKLKQTSKQKIIVDCKDVTYISSTGIGALFEILKLTSALKLSMFFINIDEKVYEVIQLLGLTSMMSIIKNLEEVT